MDFNQMLFYAGIVLLLIVISGFAIKIVAQILFCIKVKRFKRKLRKISINRGE
jgi:uncharacterized integral membrane protein